MERKCYISAENTMHGMETRYRTMIVLQNEPAVNQLIGTEPSLKFASPVAQARSFHG